MRKKMKRWKDKKVFKATANKTNSKNLSSNLNMRGGFHL